MQNGLKRKMSMSSQTLLEIRGIYGWDETEIFTSGFGQAQNDGCSRLISITGEVKKKAIGGGLSTWGG